MHRCVPLLITVGLVCPEGPGASVVHAASDVTPEVKQKMVDASPSDPYAQPTHPRRLLVFTLTRGFRHDSIPFGTEALQALGQKTGAFSCVISDDVALFEPQALTQFDAICLLNTTGELFLPPNYRDLPPPDQAKARDTDIRLKQSLLDFVSGGKGLVGIHAATDCFYDWPAYGELIGGYFNGHPWNEDVVIKLDDPSHPLNAPFAGAPLHIRDEIYQFREPYSRKTQRVLLRLDTGATDMTKDGIRRNDGDFAVSWVRQYGKGRVFYCSLGHWNHIFWNPQVLRHYLAGIQFALGDLSADTTPNAARENVGWTPLFNGQDLSGWKGLVADPHTRRTMNREQLQQLQAAADESMRAHWTVTDGVLCFDGKGQNICTVSDYSDFELTLDWRIEPGGDSGIYLRGSPQVQIWDAAQWPEGSGGLYNNQRYPSKPLVRADRPPGEWNSFRIRMTGPRLTVWLNSVLVTDDVTMENYWERDRGIYETGQIELQAHNTPVQFRNIQILDLSRQTAQSSFGPSWRPLFNGENFDGWILKPGSWAIEQGVLAQRGGGYIWTTEEFGDFTLELEFRIEKGGNSGIFFRTTDIEDCVQTGIELQIADSYGKQTPDKHDCGALYDCAAPVRNVCRPPGEWNHVVLECEQGKIRVAMNGEWIIDVDLDMWKDPRRNPDGTPNKFRTAYGKMPRTGRIGFQDHGTPVWYRNIRIRELRK